MLRVWIFVVLALSTASFSAWAGDEGTCSERKPWCYDALDGCLTNAQNAYDNCRQGCVTTFPEQCLNACLSAFNNANQACGTAHYQCCNAGGGY